MTTTNFCVVVKIGFATEPKAARLLPVPVTVNETEVGSDETPDEAACRKAVGSLACSLDCGEVVLNYAPHKVAG